MIQMKTRRNFLTSITLLISGCWWKPRDLFRQKSLVLAIPYSDRKKLNVYGVIFIDLNTRKTHHVSTDFGIHNLVYDKITNRWIGVNSYGNQFLLIDVEKQKTEVKSIQIPNVLLSGHIDTRDDLDAFYLTGVNSVTQQNLIVSMQKKDFQCHIRETFKGSDPPIHDGKIDVLSGLYYTTFGQLVIKFNPKRNHTELRTVPLGFPQSSVRHFSVINNKLCIQSNEIQTGLKVKYAKAEVVYLTQDKVQRMKLKEIDPLLENLELLDFTFLPNLKQFASTHNFSNLLTIWNSEPLQHEATIQFPENLIRVCPSENPSQLLVLAQNSLYELNLMDKTFKPISFDRQIFKSSFTYGHETLAYL